MLGRKKIYKGSRTNKLGPREQRKDQSREDEKNKTKTSTLCNNAFSLSLSLSSLSLSQHAEPGTQFRPKILGAFYSQHQYWWYLRPISLQWNESWTKQLQPHTKLSHSCLWRFSGRSFHRLANLGAMIARLVTCLLSWQQRNIGWRKQVTANSTTTLNGESSND